MSNLRVKVGSEHVVKAYGGNWLVTPLFLNLGTRWSWVVIFTFRPLSFWRTKPGPCVGPTACLDAL